MLRRSTLLTTLACTIALAGMATQGRTDPAEASIKHLQQVLTVQRDGSHLAKLASLRQLRDPSLRMLFGTLVDHEDWQIQAHALLGLAELGEEGGLDLDALQAADEKARKVVIAFGLEQGYFTGEQIATMLEWETLDAFSRLRLAAHRLTRGETIDTAPLEALSLGEALPAATVATALLIQAGHPVDLDGVLARIANADPRPRQEALVVLFEVVRDQGIIVASGALVSLLEGDTLDVPLRELGIAALIAIAPDRGYEAWTAALGDSPTHRDEVRALLALLEADPSLTSRARNTITADEDDALIDLLLEAGEAVSTGQNITTRLTALLEREHRASTAWVLRTLEDLPGEEAIPIFERMLESAIETDPIDRARIPLAIEASKSLMGLDPQRLLAHLETTDDDSRAQQIVLLGLLEERSPQVLETVASVRRIGAGLSDSLTLLLEARYADDLDPIDLRSLGVIAAGGGRVSTAYQVQAAWLYLKHAGVLDDVMTRIALVPKPAP